MPESIPATPRRIPALAIGELTAALGGEHVVTDPLALADYERATFATSQRAGLVVRPGSTEDVSAVVRVANRHGFGLYPVSRGRNWGLGSRVPMESGSCIVDLARMNHIVEFDEHTAFMTIEPGVTFEQVACFLRERGSQLYLSATGGPPDASVLANVLERGDGVGPIGNRACYCCGLTVVLPSGETLHTGFEAFGGSLAAKVGQFGLGPDVGGLFFQSNLGIVTRMNVWLARRPGHFQLAVVVARSEDEVTAATAAIRGLQQRGVLGDTAYSLWNVYRFMTAITRYPWSPSGEPLESPRALLERLPAAWKGMRWIGFVGIYSPSIGHALSSRLMIRRALHSKVTRYFVIDSLKDAIARLLRWPLRKLTGTDVSGMLDSLYYRSVFIGQPTKMETSSVYWRKRGPRPDTIDPDRDHCGLHWICIGLPFDGQHVVRTTAIVESVALRHGLEPMCMYFNMTQWFLKSFIVILFDRDVPDEEQAARRCHDELFETLTRSGYPPVRLGIQSMTLAAPAERAYVDLIERLKRGLDPNDVLAPGRYDFRQHWRGAMTSAGRPVETPRDQVDG